MRPSTRAGVANVGSSKSTVEISLSSGVASGSWRRPRRRSGTACRRRSRGSCNNRASRHSSLLKQFASSRVDARNDAAVLYHVQSARVEDGRRDVGQVLRVVPAHVRGCRVAMGPRADRERAILRRIEDVAGPVVFLPVMCPFLSRSIWSKRLDKGPGGISFRSIWLFLLAS